MNLNIPLASIAILPTVKKVLLWFGVVGSLELFAAYIVAIGCLGELWIILNKLNRHIDEVGKTSSAFWKILAWADAKFRPILIKLKINGRKLPVYKEELLERFCVALVAFGVALEFCVLPFGLHEVATLNDRASSNEVQVLTLQKELDKTKNIHSAVAEVDLWVDWKGQKPPDGDIPNCRATLEVFRIPQGSPSLGVVFMPESVTVKGDSLIVRFSSFPGRKLLIFTLEGQSAPRSIQLLDSVDFQCRNLDVTNASVRGGSIEVAFNDGAFSKTFPLPPGVISKGECVYNMTGVTNAVVKVPISN